jgi:hypothetical protein
VYKGELFPGGQVQLGELFSGVQVQIPARWQIGVRRRRTDATRRTCVCVQDYRCSSAWIQPGAEDYATRPGVVSIRIRKRTRPAGRTRALDIELGVHLMWKPRMDLACIHVMH